MTLYKSENYYSDWYGFLTNQCSRMLVAMLVVLVLCLFTFVLSGELPRKYALMTMATVGYFLYELISQGWVKSDTLQDTLFFFLGAILVVVPFSEDTIGSLIVSFDIVSTIPIIVFSGVCLFVGCFVRYLREFYLD